MELLTDPVLTKVFTQLDYKTRETCAMVCRKWQTVIDRNIGEVVHVEVGNKIEMVKSHKHIRVISEIGVSDCIISGRIGDETNIPKFKYPLLVNSIKFDCHISRKNYNLLVEYLINLQKLSICEDSLIEVGMGKAFTGFKRLTSFELSYTKDPRFDSSIRWSRQLALQNMIELLDSVSFPELKTLSITTICCPKIEDFLMGHISDCVFRHKEHLRVLHLGFHYAEISEYLAFLKNATCPLPILRQLRLHKFTVSGTNGITRRLRDKFNNIILKQRCLRYYGHLHGSFTFPTELILNNLRTLVNMDITYDGVEEHLIDLSSTIGECKSLKYLSIFNICIPNVDKKNGGGEVAGLKSFPKSLESIQLRNIRTKEDLKPFIQEYPKLKRLVLISTVGERGKELGMEDINKILTTKSIVEVFIGYKDRANVLKQKQYSARSHPLFEEIRRNIFEVSAVGFYLVDGDYKFGISDENLFEHLGHFQPTNFVGRFVKGIFELKGVVRQDRIWGDFVSFVTGGLKWMNF